MRQFCKFPVFFSLFPIKVTVICRNNAVGWDEVGVYGAQYADPGFFFFLHTRLAEQSQTKCVGITIETRPDYCLDQHLSSMLRYGCTRLEIGVQSLYEDVARDTNRGHTVKAVCETFKLAKDAGYKVVSHMMPDLPNVGMERDLDQFRVSEIISSRHSSSYFMFEFSF